MNSRCSCSSALVMPPRISLADQRVGDHAVGQQADGLRAIGPQAPGQQARPVAELAGRPQTRSWASAEIRMSSRPVVTKDAVVRDTPASAATSISVTRGSGRLRHRVHPMTRRKEPVRPRAVELTAT